MILNFKQKRGIVLFNFQEPPPLTSSFWGALEREPDALSEKHEDVVPTTTNA